MFVCKRKYQAGAIASREWSLPRTDLYSLNISCEFIPPMLMVKRFWITEYLYLFIFISIIYIIILIT